MTIFTTSHALHCQLSGDTANSSVIQIFAHPLMSSIDYERAVAAPNWFLLDTYAPIIAFDARGHGKSPTCHDPERFTWEALAEDLLEVISETAKRYPDKKIVPIGASMGAGALLFALLSTKLPPQVTRAVIAIPPTYGQVRKTSAEALKRLSVMVRDKGIDGLVKAIGASPEAPFFAREFPEVRSKALGFIAKSDALSMAAAFEGAANSDFPSSQRLSNLDLPLLILSRKDDPAHPVAAAEYLATHTPNSTLEVGGTRDDIESWIEVVGTFCHARME